MSNQEQRTIRFGVNYTPGRRWYYCWNDWDLREIEADLDAVASLGVDHIRLQLIWPWFQPNPTWVSPGHLKRLRELMEAAAAREIDVLVTLLTGFLSGYFFMPPFVRERAQTFTSDGVFESEVQFAREVLGVVGQVPNFMGFDVGNEINCLDHSLPTEQGDAWGRRFAQALSGEMHGRPIVNGIDHTPLLAGSTFSMQHLANDYDITCLHAWPLFSGCLAKGSLRDAPSLHVAAFFTQLIRLWASDAAKPVWIQEFGACDLWGSPEEQEAYMRGSIDLAIRNGATLFTWWCSHDKTGEIRFSEYEYHYGLFTPGNQAKPLAATYREMIDRYAKVGVSTMRAEHDCAVMVPAGFEPQYLKEYPKSQYIEQTLASSTWRLFDVYLSQVAAGRRPVLMGDGKSATDMDVIDPGKQVLGDG